jgi:hypothetical protein
MPNYQGYNYGVSGYGTQHLLAQTSEKITPEEIKQRQGILIYFFIDNHLNRLVGSRRIIKLWGENFPYFFLDDDKKLQQSGTFKPAENGKLFFTKFLPIVPLLIFWIWKFRSISAMMILNWLHQ